jgi:hypothetical protein
MFIFFYPNNLGCLVVAICKRFANNIGEIFIFFITAATTLHSCPNIATTVTEEVQAVGQPKIKNTSVLYVWMRYIFPKMHIAYRKRHKFACMLWNVFFD